MVKAESARTSGAGVEQSPGTNAQPPSGPRAEAAATAKSVSSKAAKSVSSKAAKSVSSKAAKSVSSKAAKSAAARSNQKFLDEMRRKLLKERAKYLHSAEEYQAEAESLLSAREPGDVQFDEEGGEGTTVAVERERDLALSSQARHTVSQIDAALARIDDGTYGYCVTSGAPIPIARLRAIPWAAERVEVKAGGLGRR